MRIPVCLVALAVACGSAPPKPVPDSTREAVDQMPDAGARPANEPGGSTMGMAGAGPEGIGAEADAGMGDGGANLRDGAADAGAQAGNRAGTSGATVKQGLLKRPPWPP